MTHICKCSGVSSHGAGLLICAQREKCYRYTVPEGFWQPYFCVAPLKADMSCDFFEPNAYGACNANKKRPEKS